MQNKEEILKILNNLKKELIREFKVKEIGIFGSYAMDKQEDFSDIDVLVEFEKDADLFNFVGLSIFLEENLKKKVDLVSKKALREEIKDNILTQVIYT